MKSIQRRFNQALEQKSIPSTFICFVEAIKDQPFTSAMMRRWFYKLVEKDDYDPKNKKQIIQWLETLLKVA